MSRNLVNLRCIVVNADIAENESIGPLANLRTKLRLSNVVCIFACLLGSPHLPARRSTSAELRARLA